MACLVKDKWEERGRIERSWEDIVYTKHEKFMFLLVQRVLVFVDEEKK